MSTANFEPWTSGLIARHANSMGVWGVVLQECRLSLHYTQALKAPWTAKYSGYKRLTTNFAKPDGECFIWHQNRFNAWGSGQEKRETSNANRRTVFQLYIYDVLLVYVHM